jgi:FtsP/CotA-like multicopper oxidase with cupredoxin domain
VPERWRVVNATPIEHPMHLHGFYFNVDGVGDGQSQRYYSAAEHRTAVTESVPPGHSFDMTWLPERAGNWLFHCHILDHMSAIRSPIAYGPKGPPPDMPQHAQHGDDAMGMAKLVLGITVSDHTPKLLPAKEVIRDIGASRHLIVRERPAASGSPSRPGIYLEGASQSIAAIGPPLIITQNVPTAVTVTNELQEPTAIHWHGIEIESYYDGVPGWNGTPQNKTPMIPPAGSFVAHMTPPRAGTFIYHTHWHNVDQLTGGVYGPLLVLPADQKYDPATDKVFVLGRSGANEFHDPLVLNGSPQPGVMFLLMGRTYRLRFINITPNDSPVDLSMTYAGRPAPLPVPDTAPKLREGEVARWRALAKDGADLPETQAQLQNAHESLSVGETRDFQFDAQVPGQYVLRLRSPFGSEVAQVISVVPPAAPISVYAETR